MLHTSRIINRSLTRVACRSIGSTSGGASRTISTSTDSIPQVSSPHLPSSLPSKALVPKPTFASRPLQPAPATISLAVETSLPPLIILPPTMQAPPPLSQKSAVKDGLPETNIPIFTTVAALREWRKKAFDQGLSVGFVATMGALHDGHMSLVQNSLAENDLTVLSIFVNPAQFAPHEDLATYPRTLPSDLALYSSLPSPTPSSSSPSLSFTNTPKSKPKSTLPQRVLFLPTVPEIYPSGITQSPTSQRGTFVEVAGFSAEMEGRSRPTFFRGVATIVTKLFCAVQPTRAYFGQKDIQQGLLLRRMCRDLLMSHPEPGNVRIVRTKRDEESGDGLALSSRNVYLSEEERGIAGVLYRALKVAEEAWRDGNTKKECIERAKGVIEEVSLGVAKERGLEMKLDYVEMNDADTFGVVEGGKVRADQDVLLSGAVWVGRTRLIDNLILGDVDRVLG